MTDKIKVSHLDYGQTGGDWSFDPNKGIENAEEVRASMRCNHRIKPIAFDNRDPEFRIRRKGVKFTRSW